jgi:AcrR family transcriptional regulator
LSIGAVAQAAGTTRPSVYLRFSSKEDLATRAIAGMRADEPLRVSEDVRADLIAELRHFQAAATRPNGMSLVGTVLAEEHQTPALIERFRERLVRPRRRRVAQALDWGARSGLLRAGLDAEVLTAVLVGSVYAHYLATGRIPPDWAERVVAALWPALQAPPE